MGQVFAFQRCSSVFETASSRPLHCVRGLPSRRWYTFRCVCSARLVVEPIRRSSRSTMMYAVGDSNVQEPEGSSFCCSLKCSFTKKSARLRIHWPVARYGDFYCVGPRGLFWNGQDRNFPEALSKRPKRQISYFDIDGSFPRIAMYPE